jgi:hypothetical protein
MPIIKPRSQLHRNPMNRTQTQNSHEKWINFRGHSILARASERSLSAKCEITIARDANLELNFKGQMKVRKLTLEDKEQPAGTYSATSASGFIAGTGVLIVGS